MNKQKSGEIGVVLNDHQALEKTKAGEWDARWDMVGCRLEEEPPVTFEMKGKASRQREQQSQRPAVEVACPVPGAAPIPGAGGGGGCEVRQAMEVVCGGAESHILALVLPLTSRVWS